MNLCNSLKKLLCALLAAALIPSFFSGCAGPAVRSQAPLPPDEPDTARYLISIEDEPDTVDFQCTSIHYTVAQNVFNRLVSMENDDAGRCKKRLYK